VSQPLRRYTARWVLPVEGAPLEHGAVLVDEAGRIAAVGPESELAGGAAETVALGNAVVVRGLINCHTHLELTGFDHAITADDFPGWIRQLIALKAARTAEQVLAAARQGVRDCWASGVTTVADTGDSGAVIQALSQLGGSGIAYHEVFGPDPSLADQHFAGWVGRLAELRQFATERVYLGASPHAPYSVSGPLYEKVARYAAEAGLPVAVHLAESQDESLLLESATGSFARMWEGRGIARPALPGRSPVAWLDQHQVLGPRTLCIHTVRVSHPDIATLARRGVAIAHCPRSNRSHGHGDAPLKALLAAGLRVGVGTDSVASVAPLDLRAEARAARELAGLSAEATLRLLTLDAARVLGLEADIGSLVPGKWADLAAFELPPEVDGSRLVDTLLGLPADSCLATIIGGRTVFTRLG
jgi:5-methylthioadenosine/S-adenosylhomocysteine deaminase